MSSVLGGSVIEVKQISNGYIVIRLRYEGSQPEITYIEELSELGDMLVGKFVKDKLDEANAMNTKLGAVASGPAMYAKQVGAWVKSQGGM